MNTNTKAAYGINATRYDEWCELKGKSKSDEEVTDESVAQFALYSFKEKGLAYSTVMGRVSAISERVRFVRDLKKEKTPMESLLVKGVLDTIRDQAPPVQHRKICTADHIKKIVELFWEKDMEMYHSINIKGGHKKGVDVYRTGIRDMLCFIFARVFLLRASEVVILKHGDININEKFETKEKKIVTAMTLTLRKSKNFKNKHETHDRIVIEAEGVYKRLCPIMWYKRYIKYIDLRSKEEWEKLFIFDKEDGSKLSKNTVNHRLKYWLERAGIQKKKEKNGITFHGIRVGGTTDAANSDMNVPTNMIKHYGHWSSNAAHIYMREKKDNTAVSTAITNV